MVLDNDVEDGDCVIDGGDVKFRFSSPEAKQQFLRMLQSMVRKNDRNREEGYKCGHCAAYPCFRMCYPSILEFIKKYRPQNTKKISWLEESVRREAMQPAGLCFQATRRCRQECDSYRHDPEKFKDGWGWAPADDGICRVDKTKVKYEQECHVPEMRSKVK